MCDLVLGRTTIAFLSLNDLDFEVDYVLLLQKMAGSEVWVPQTTEGFDMKPKVLQDFARSRKKRKKKKKSKKKHMRPLC